MSVSTIAIGEYLFKREFRDGKPYKIQVITKPEDGIVGIRYSNGAIGTIDMAYLYRTWGEAEEIAPVAIRSKRHRQEQNPTRERWTCDCGALNTPASNCWRCGKKIKESRLTF